MNRKTYRLSALFAAVVFVGLSLFLTARPAAAVTPWVKWRIDFTYPGKLDALLVVERGYTNQSGDHIVVDVVQELLTCQSVGNPVLQNGKAILDGSSYFQCTMPSVKAIAAQEWQMTIADSCSSKRPYVIGRASIEGSPADFTPSNPVFYREDIQFGIPLDVSTQKAKLAMTIDQALAQSDLFAIAPAAQQFVGYFARSGPATYAPHFFVDGTSLAPTPAAVTPSMFLTTLETTIYLGHSPVSGDSFEGTLGPLRVDPVCTGTG
ncbi:MAG: hypothetical protein H6667_08100 [Ardenticatenaceae bacterium]|nr:hypothetical protein [Ardenticatenaceae bacterium]MCB9444682.1 hypothetical protein [Ardenticatenaceae bacterium]